MLEDQLGHIIEILRHEIKTTLKFYISLEVEVILDETFKIANFQSRATQLTKSMDFEEEVTQHKEILVEKIETYASMGSDWIVNNIKSINIMVTHL